MADVIVFAVVFGVCGLITGDWDGAIGGGVSAGGGGNLLYQWWNGRTAQPEYEEEDNDE
ncbi:MULTISPECIES: hypothetical protein [unclassified Streptomyces]|uniref:hypothetical protein n=1 Tax=unclassified Streptomyces TaxID=2593676 RepID=UPI002E16F043|nr:MULTISPECIES: hypothetical protein [unclassified Streptomyces]